MRCWRNTISRSLNTAITRSTEKRFSTLPIRGWDCGQFAAVLRPERRLRWRLTPTEEGRRPGENRPHEINKTAEIRWDRIEMGNQGMKLNKYSVGTGDRFAHQAKAQLQACIKALDHGIEVVPVWNKSNREHNI